jgi:hypothetical protein
MKRFLIFFSMFTSCAFAATDNSGVANYRYISAIALPEPTQGEELAQVLLTPEMFNATLDNYADIRIMRTDTKQMVPCLVECVTEEQHKIRRIVEPLTVTGAVEEPDGQLRVTLSRSKPQPPLHGLTVGTPLRNFERHVRVEVSDNGNTWETVVAQARIFDVSSFADVRVTDIALPSVSQYYIRLTFNTSRDQQTGAVTQVRTSADGKGAVSAIDRSFREEQRPPCRVDKVDGWNEETYGERDVRPLRTREIRDAGVQIPPLGGHFLSGLPKDSIWKFFEADRVPLESLTMDTENRFRFVKVPYDLFVEVERTDGTDFRKIASGVLERVAFRDYLSERMTITWPTTRAKRYCLTVPDNAEPVLTFAEAKGPDYRVVFPYAKGDSMALLAGNPDAKSSGFHADQIKMLMRTIASPRLAEPSPLEQNPAWRSGMNVNMTYVLAFAIALTVVVLGFASFFAIRRMKTMNGEEW